MPAGLIPSSALLSGLCLWILSNQVEQRIQDLASFQRPCLSTVPLQLKVLRGAIVNLA
jgi:hypothetical protein